MSDKFPPTTTHELEVDGLLNILGSVIPGQSAAYVSAPITSGRRFADWLKTRNLEGDLSHPETYQDFQREVLEPNCEHARAIIGKLRKKFPRALIDPTALKDIDGWTQDDYRYLWAKVIEQYAETVVFVDGWQYSNGCSYEFLTASRLGEEKQRLVLKENLEPLTVAEGLTLLKAAITHMQTSHLPTAFLERTVDELTKVGSREEICAEP